MLLPTFFNHAMVYAAIEQTVFFYYSIIPVVNVEDKRTQTRHNTVWMYIVAPLIYHGMPIHPLCTTYHHI